MIQERENRDLKGKTAIVKDGDQRRLNQNKKAILGEKKTREFLQIQKESKKKKDKIRFYFLR